MNKISISFFLIISFFILSSAYSQNESLTITTYYPSPYGSYRELRSTKVAIGDTYIDHAEYSWETGATKTISAEADLVVEGRVGIGTVTPQSSLHVKGESGGFKFPGLFVEDTITSPSRRYSFYIDPARYLVIGDESLDLVNSLGYGLGRILVTPGDKTGFLAVDGSTGNVGIGTVTPEEKLHIAGNARTNGIKFPDNSLMTSAKLSCTRVTTGWISIVNHTPYSVSAPAGYQGITCEAHYYDNNGAEYHGYNKANWNSDRTQCSMTPNDTGITVGELFAEFCRIP